MSASPRPGDLIRLGRAASVQFTTPILFRVIRVHDWITYDRWVWLDGYQLDATGKAIDRRSVFVQIRGIQHAHPSPMRRQGALPSSPESRPDPFTSSSAVRTRQSRAAMAGIGEVA